MACDFVDLLEQQKTYPSLKYGLAWQKKQHAF